ncbi:ADP/ATP translocase 1-like isoform X2 [Cimex lectularius]|uniref:ADP,ATP carrier protein n=1 Tax=Cimex lectularius TaxID=79782 RepID=A0A8I6S1E3_CIMLE|nr:ADP/ATP translocase 1-like isoform X2 [Cimex lectularius]
MPATHKDDTNHKNLYSKTDIFLVNFVSSGLAAALSKTATAPLERVKLILQTGALKSENPALKKHGLYQTVRYLVIKQGFLALWRGNTLTVAKAVPSQALLFSFQDFYRHIIFSNEPGLSKQKSTMYSLFAGGLASGTVIGITYPFYFCQNIVSSHVGKIESARD